MISLLIAEDNEKMRRLLKSLLEDFVSDVWECGDGGEAVTAYNRHRPDLVVMDIRMKLMDGITATRQIKAADPAARIIIVTDYDHADLREAAQQAGACAFVGKENLLELVRIVQATSANPDPGP
jgi:CheY-like chemotaxis protein